MGERGLSMRSDMNKQTWEESSFPLLCSECLGKDKYIRMMKTSFDRACRVCDRPFSVFRWRPGAKSRFNKTEICSVCSKTKNVCQACLSDLETGESMLQRDKHLDLENKFGAPKDIVNKDYWAQLKTMQVDSPKKILPPK